MSAGRETIRINVFDPRSVDAAIKAVEEYRKWLDEKSAELIVRLKRAGFYILDDHLQKAVVAGRKYASTYDYWNVNVDYRDGMYIATIGYSGETALIVEFGSGLRYDNEYMREHGYAPGSAGPQGLNPKGWWYSGTPGSNPPEDTEEAYTRFGRANWEGKSIHTYGSPANRTLSLTRSDLKDKIEGIVKEVFKR